MTALLATTGPALFYVGLGAPGAYKAYYLGTAEAAPLIEKQPLYTPVYADEGGDAPFDYVYHGEPVVVSAVLNRFDGGTYARITQRPRQGYRVLTDGGRTGELARGVQSKYEVGALMVRNSFATPLFIAFPHANRAAMRDQGMPPGYYFPASFLVTDTDRPGSQPQSLVLAWTAARAFVSPQSGVVNPGGFFTYANGDRGYALPPLPPASARGEAPDVAVDYDEPNGPQPLSVLLDDIARATQ